MAFMKNGADVLVVEDDAQLNELVGAYVKIAGFGYRHALDGTTAISEAQAHHPKLIILDIMLPDIDGFEVCRRLKSDQATRAIPVLMLTALSQEESRRKGMELGASGYMTKPFDPDKLIAAIQEQTNHH